MADKNTTPPSEGDPKDTAGFPVGEYGSHPTTNDHRTLVDALKQAFGDRSVYPPPSTEVKVGMDETIPNGKYIRFGQLVNAHGEPIDEQGNKLKKD